MGGAARPIVRRGPPLSRGIRMTLPPNPYGGIMSMVTSASEFELFLKSLTGWVDDTVIEAEPHGVMALQSGGGGAQALFCPTPSRRPEHPALRTYPRRGRAEEPRGAGRCFWTMARPAHECTPHDRRPGAVRGGDSPSRRGHAATNRGHPSRTAPRHPPSAPAAGRRSSPAKGARRLNR